MFLLIYEISGKKDVHGLRIRLVYNLRKQGATQLMRSSWLISSIEPALKNILNECIEYGFPVLMTKWNPTNLPDHVRDEADTLLVGVVIHSPEVTELGITKDFLNELDKVNFPFHAILGGVMGRLAILDAQLEEKVFINHPFKPSEAIDYLIKRNVDVIVLLNQGISLESGIEFGRQVMENSNLLPFYKVPLFQLDRLRDDNAFFICWRQIHPKFQKWLDEIYHLKKVEPPSTQVIVKREGDFVTRILRAVQLGDKILVDGVIIGEVTSNTVELTTKSSHIQSISGGLINYHGIEKLGAVDLNTARITTLKSLKRSKTSSKRKISLPKKKKTYVAMLTWRGEQVYFHADKIDSLVSIGDDTTFVSTEILSRFSRPVIGIIDGDADGIVYAETSLSQLAAIAPANSLFIQVQAGKDDIVGKRIQREIFKNRTKMKYSDLNKLKNRILELSKKNLIDKIEVTLP